MEWINVTDTAKSEQVRQIIADTLFMSLEEIGADAGEKYKKLQLIIRL